MTTFIRQRSLIARLIVASVTLFGWAVSANNIASASTTSSPKWQTVWTSPTDIAEGLTYNSTTRDIATMPVAGTSIVLSFSNEWSSTATTFAAVTVGVDQSGIDVVPGTIRPITFNHGSRSVTIAPYSRVSSDPVRMSVHGGESLAVSLATAGSSTVSVHFCCDDRVDSYATGDGAGNLTNSPTGVGFNPLLASSNMRWLTSVVVAGSPAQGTVVALGDSITDGFGYTNHAFSWVNALQARISKLPAAQQMSVVNEGIAGNTLTVFPPHTSYDDVSGGVPGVTRLLPDALDLPGVKDVVLFLGTNDIWFGAGGEAGHPIPPYGTAAAIENAMSQVIAETHAHGVRITGVTLLPRSSSNGVDGEKPEAWLPTEQSVLSAVNAWMLSPISGFDAVINLAAVMGDVYNGACQPTLPYSGYFNSDNLHPNTAGQTVMADAISTVLFGAPQAPQVPQLVNVTPTPGCAGALLATQTLALGSQPSPTTTTSSTTTTTVHITPTTRPSGSSRGRRLDYIFYLVIALIAVAVIALWNTRRRAKRRRALHRRTRPLARYPGTVPPRRRPPPPRSGPNPPPRR
jgi:lysophospholipase L1-like esterase